MDILLHLSHFLENQPAAGLEGLGTFVKKKVPGRYDAHSHTFLPPSFTLVFEPFVTAEEAFLQYLAEQEKCTKEEARSYIQSFTAQIVSDLQLHQKVSLHPLGDMILSAPGELAFEAASSLSLGHDFFGLPSFPIQKDRKEEETAPVLPEESLPPAEEKAEAETVLSAVPEMPTPQPPSEPVQEEAVWRPTRHEYYGYDPGEEEDEKEGRSKTWIKVLILLLIIGIAGAGVYFFYPDFFKKKGMDYEPAPLPDTTAVLIDSIPLNLGDEYSQDSLPIQEKDTLATTTAPLSPPLTYEVIGGAMKSQQKVDEIIGNLARVNIFAKTILPSSGRMIKISLGSFTDFNKAKKYQDSMRIRLKNPGIYIETIKHTNQQPK